MQRAASRQNTAVYTASHAFGNFNAADVVVVGRFAGNEALAAVGSTGALTNLLVNMFIGLSVGANVLVARYYGAKQEEEVSRTVHTSMLISDGRRRLLQRGVCGGACGGKTVG